MAAGVAGVPGESHLYTGGWCRLIREKNKKALLKPMARGNLKIDLAQVLKLKLQGFSTRQIGRQLGVHHSSVHARLKGLAEITKNPDLVRVFKQNEAAFIDGARMKALMAVVEKLADPAQAKRISLGKLATAYGILYDKARLERDESTANVMSLSELVRAAHEEHE